MQKIVSERPNTSVSRTNGVVQLIFQRWSTFNLDIGVAPGRRGSGAFAIKGETS